MLIDYFTIIAEISQKAQNMSFVFEKTEEPVNKKLDMKIEQLDLSVRLFNSLKRSAIYTVGQIINQTEEDVMRLRSLGRKSFKELKEKLAEHGLEFLNSSKDHKFDLEDEDNEERE